MEALVDQQRPLNDHGKVEVMIVAGFLIRTKQPIQQIYYSEKLRAKETAEIIAQNLPTKPKIAELSGLHPEDDVKPIANDCNHWQENTLLVGHLPFMARLASELLAPQQILSFQFETAAILCLEAIGHRDWSLSWFVSPDLVNC